MKKQKVSVSGSVVTVEYPTIGKSASIDSAKLSPAMQQEAMLHGLKQKLGDAESGKSPTEKYAMVQRIIENMLAGDWELTATRDDSAIIIEAIAKIKKVKIAEVESSLSEMDNDEKAEKLKEWRAHPKVKAVIAQIRAERAAQAAKGVDDDDISLD